MVKDYLGQEIHIGDFVVYPGRSGCCMWMNRGTIVGWVQYETGWNNGTSYKLRIKKVCENWNRTIRKDRLVTVTNVKNVVVIHSVTESK